MLKTGQLNMEVNTVPGIIVYKSEDGRGEMSGDVKVLQARDSCLFCKKICHQKRYCCSPTKTGRRRIQTGRQKI